MDTFKKNDESKPKFSIVPYPLLYLLGSNIHRSEREMLKSFQSFRHNENWIKDMINNILDVIKDLHDSNEEYLVEITKIFEHGVKKYGLMNYTLSVHERPEIVIERLLSAYFRHRMSNEIIDKESGLSHIFHAFANLGMMLYRLYYELDK